MAIARAVHERIKENPPPSATVVREAVEQYVTDASIERRDLAEHAGISYMTLRSFLNGYYKSIAGTDLYIREKLWRYLQAHPVRPTRIHAGPRFETRAAERLRELIHQARRKLWWILVESPPGTQKSYVLENDYVARNRAGQRDTAYVYASCSMSPGALLRAIANSLGSPVRGDRERLKKTLRYAFSQRPHPPVLLIDEGQHLVAPYARELTAIEDLRELTELSGCGLVIASSHAFRVGISNHGGYLWQWIRRFQAFERLEGLTDDEVIVIAEKHLGRKLTLEQRRVLLVACREERFGGKKRSYYSCGLLWEQLKQLKADAEGKESA